jgi:KDO2-lipid IV(A) lauroyltransferase
MESQNRSYSLIAASLMKAKKLDVISSCEPESVEAKTVGEVNARLGTNLTRMHESVNDIAPAKTSKPVSSLRTARHTVEFFGAYLAFTLFRLLPVDIASAIGGHLFRVVGPLSREHEIANQNIRRALPHLADSEIRSVLLRMWDNLGRVAAEMPHLAQFAHDAERIEIIDDDDILGTLKRSGKGALIVSAHYGNWELGAIPAFRAGVVQHAVYRVPNNPFVDRLVSMLRRPVAAGKFFPKGRKGLWNIVVAFRRREVVGMFIDQKLKEGAVIPFFGRDARTTVAPATLSGRFNVPILLLKVERLCGAQFRITLSRFKPVQTSNGKDRVIEWTHQLNAILEDWIRERPDHWLWIHRRWHN